MQAVSDNHHLSRRNGVYCYSRRVPDGAVALIGRGVMRISLKTSDKKTAKRLRAVHDINWSPRFAAAESATEALKLALKDHHQPLTASLAPVWCKTTSSGSTSRHNGG